MASPGTEHVAVSQGWVHQAIETNNQALIVQMKSIFHESVTELKRSSADQTQVQIREMKKLKFSDVPKFKKLGNEDQFKFNSRVEDNLKEASDALRTDSLPKVKQLIEDGISMIGVRQKHILLADQSQAGWAVVQQYKQHDLAEDSEDEKKIIRAETRAKSNVLELRKKQRPKVISRNFSTAEPRVNYRNQQNSSLPTRIQPIARGPCFSCGKFGHLRSTCPSLQKNMNS